MPDWVAHLGFAFLCGKAAKLRPIALLLAGALIPDIGKAVHFLPVSARDAYALSLPFHSPAFAFVVAGILAAFVFRKVELRAAFSLLFAGALTHLLLDAMMLYTIGGVVLLVPFSYERFSLLNFFPSQSFLPALLFSALVLGYVLVGRVLKSRPQN